MAANKKIGKGCQMKWTEAMEETLLYLVIAKGVHICTKAESTKKWKELIADMYDNAEFLSFKEVFYDKENIRPAKEKYNAIKDSCNRMMRKQGNLSAMETSDMSPWH